MIVTEEGKKKTAEVKEEVEKEGKVAAEEKEMTGAEIYFKILYGI